MKKTHFQILAVVLVGLIAYSNSFEVPFQFDDLRIIPDNTYIKNLENFNFLKEHKYDPRDEYNPRRYLGYLSLAMNYRWGGLEVTGYHIVNLLIHLIAGILVYFLVLLTFRTPYFKGEKLEVSGEKAEAGNDPPAAGISSQLTTRYSLLTTDNSYLIAFFSALLFVSHPVQTQAVTYIVQRFTSLAALFYLLAVVMYIKGRLVAGGKGQGARDEVRANESIAHRLSPVAYYLLSLLSAVCAMKTKEITFTLPIMIILYEFTFFKSTLKRKLIFLVPVLLTLVIIPLSMLHIDKPLGEVLSDLSEKSRLQTDMPRADYLMTEMRVIVTYIRLLILPVNQNLDYDYPVYRTVFTAPVLLSFLFLSALIGTAVWLLYRSRQGAIGYGQERQGVMGHGPWEKDKDEEGVPVACRLSPIISPVAPDPWPFASLYRLIAFGILWFFLALSVESSFIPIVDVIFEHRLYLPSVGAFVALSAALFAAVLQLKKIWPQTGKLIILFSVMIVASLSGATFARNRVWQDEMRLWQDVARKSPGSARAHNNLGFHYYSKGMNDQAIEEFASALRLRPDYLDPRINLGLAYSAKGMHDQAIVQFMMALSTAPKDVDARNNLGISYASKGMFDQAINQYRIVAQLQPDYAEAYNNLGGAYAVKGMFDQAKENFEQAIRLKPDYFEAYHNLGLLYEKMGDPEKAAAMNSKARQLKPAS